MADKLIIFDTTLRDGEQSPGASMTRDEKLRIARQLERLRVDVIEAGFAASSDGDFEAVKAIANAITESTVCSLSRANDRDISRAAEALKVAKHSRIHTFNATSALHMEKKLRMTPDQVLEQAKQSVDHRLDVDDRLRQQSTQRANGRDGQIHQPQRGVAGTAHRRSRGGDQGADARQAGLDTDEQQPSGDQRRHTHLVLGAGGDRGVAAGFGLVELVAGR